MTGRWTPVPSPLLVTDHMGHMHWPVPDELREHLPRTSPDVSQPWQRVRLERVEVREDVWSVSVPQNDAHLGWVTGPDSDYYSWTARCSHSWAEACVEDDPIEDHAQLAQAVTALIEHDCSLATQAMTILDDLVAALVNTRAPRPRWSIETIAAAQRLLRGESS